MAKLGGVASGSRLITPEEGAVLVEELEATAPFIDQRYADDVALAVRAGTHRRGTFRFLQYASEGARTIDVRIAQSSP